MIFIGGTCEKKLGGMECVHFLKPNDSTNDVQSGLGRWHNFQTNGFRSKDLSREAIALKNNKFLIGQQIVKSFI